MRGSRAATSVLLLVGEDADGDGVHIDLSGGDGE